MPPREFSRHTFVDGITVDGYFQLTLRTPFRFRALADNITYTVREGDTVFTVAGGHYQEFLRPAGLWWVVADFQPTPIHDPTRKLENGRVLFLPSPRAVRETIFSEVRRLESEL